MTSKLSGMSTLDSAAFPFEQTCLPDFERAVTPEKCMN